MKTRFHRRGVVAALGSLVVLAGCTSLDAVRVTADTKELPAAGAPYSLPFTQYEITVTRRLKACVDDKKNPALVVATTATAAPVQLPDPVRQYVIDFDSLQSAFKKTNLTVDYHPNGGIKSINAAAEDRTGQAILSVAKAVGTIAVVAAGAGGVRASACEKDIATLVDTTIPGLESDIKTQTAEVTELTADVDRLTAMATAMGKAWGKTEQKAMGTAIGKLITAKRALAAKNESLQSALKGVTHVVKVKWPANGDERISPPGTVASLPVELIAKWGTPDDEARLIREADARFEIVAGTQIGNPTYCTPACPGDASAGLKYRMPSRGTLVVHWQRTTPTGKQTQEKESVWEGMIPQLGPVFTLPLKSVPFSNRKLVATFDEAGLPTSLGVESVAATAETAASTFESLVAQAASVRAQLKPSELDELKAQTELLKARKELETAQKALQPTAQDPTAQAIAAFQADTALKQAEQANLEATRALAEARAASQGG